MQDVPKIVTARLQQHKPVPAEPHPDADLLTAFAEQSLTESERKAVLEHIAQCADCRDVIALALPVAQETMLAAHMRMRKSWLTWPALRWGVVAAGILVITSVGALQFRRRHEQTIVVARNTAPAEPVASQQNAEAKAASSEIPATEAMAGRQAAAHQAKPAPDRHLAAKAVAPSTSVPPAAPPFGGSASGSGVYEYRAGARQPGSLKTFQAPAAPVPSTTDRVAEVSQPEVVGKAKAAPKEAFALGLARAPDLRTDPSLMKGFSLVRWTISDSGTLQRSLDGGSSWEDVNVVANGNGTQMRTAKNVMTTVEVSGAAPEVKTDMNTYQPHMAARAGSKAAAGPSQPVIFHAVSVSSDSNEVWAGGSGAALYHTLDGGDSWLRVLPTDGGAVLTGDVTSIEFPDTQSGTVRTSNAEIWITFDDGKTWHKQP